MTEAFALRAPAPAYAGADIASARVLLAGERSTGSLFAWTGLLWRPAPRGLGLALALGLILGSATFGFVRGGEYASFVASQGSIGDFVARALGFDIAIVTISGQAELRESEILADAGISPKNSLLFLDVAQARARLETIPLVKQASVRKLYPNHLVIDLVERAPYGLWQKDGQVNIVAADGAVIDQMRDQRFASLPFVVGEGANERLSEFTGLLAAAGELGPKIRAGVLVANRRWNLKMTSGVDVMLPETNPLAAVATLVRLQRESRVLDRDVISLDLRLEGRMFARLTEDAAAARLAARPKKGGAT
ncbi:cell division protein FtsQ/DivIB [Methylocapsa sp. S129]|uniref:cell division protein FtsQ/DivIB n=1 Tax=Methylocapsa sp. S129 TaxID=1641869 RepID=UPI001FEF51BE|nr:FtsQ-type POTRA domain-containing protein [Methylocapsa sp. S129]